MNMAMAFNYFANSLWQVPLLALCCWCALRLARASARVQYGAWICTLLLCAGLPLRGAKPQAHTSVEVMMGDAVTVGVPQPLPAWTLPFYAVRISPRTRDVLAGLYLSLTAMLLMRLLVSHRQMRRLVRASHVAAFSVWQRELLEELGLDEASVRVLPPGHGSPMVAGVWHPVILLPAALLDEQPEVLQAVLAHEFAHVRRRDTLVNLALRSLALPVAYHPATTLIQRRIQHARELMCDAIAARTLASPNAYAQVLLRLARQRITSGGRAWPSAVGLLERNSKPLLEERIMNLIAPPAPLRVAARVLRLTAGVACFGAAAAVVSLVHLTPSVLAAPTTLPAAAVAFPAQTPVSETPAPAKPSALAPQEAAAIQQELAAARKQTEQAMAELRAPELQRQLAKVQGDAAAIRAQLNSPEFRRQIADATAEAMKDVKDNRQQLDAIQKQLNSKEFRWQIQQSMGAALKIPSQAELQTLIATTRKQDLPPAFDGAGAGSEQQDSGAAKVPAGIMAGTVVSRVQPVYPELAKAAKISGAVVMQAVIAKDGSIQHLEVLSGPPELRTSALDAVRQWVYKPYLLNGEPTEVETTITVTYSFGG